MGDVETDACPFRLVDNVKNQDHRQAGLHELERQRKHPFQVLGVHHVEEQIGPIIQQDQDVTRSSSVMGRKEYIPGVSITSKLSPPIVPLPRNTSTVVPG